MMAEQVAGTELYKPAGVIRRLGAMVYDTLLVVALGFVATAPFVPILSALHAKALVPSEVGWWAYVYRVWLLLVVALFFGFFWTWRGQTVGMQAWRLRLEREQGGLITWSQAFLRLGLAVLPWLPGLVVLLLAEHFASQVLKYFGYGLLSLGPLSMATLWLNPQRQTWHDRLTHSRVVVRNEQ